MHNGLAPQTHTLSATLHAEFEEALAAWITILPSHHEHVRYAVQDGHRTRPVGCLLACAAAGGDPRSSMSVAIAVELVHKSSVIRDDIVDGDEVRSGNAAFHSVFGIDDAIAVSDLLWTLALREVADDARCLRAFTVTLYEMASGQLEDVAPSPASRSLAARLDVEERKTGALSELACRVGATSGRGSASTVDALAVYGRKLGTAFQVLNDVRNLRGVEPARATASDLRKRRDNVLTAHVREVAPSDDRSMMEALRAGRGDLGEADAAQLRRLMLEHGADQFGESLAERLMAEARTALNDVPAGTARDILESLADDALLAYAF